MTEFLWRRILLHEIAFLLLWLGLAIALTVTGTATPADALILLVQAAAMTALILKDRGNGWHQTRLWFPLVALHVTYFWLGDAVPRFREWRADEMLWSIDRQLFGNCLALIPAPVIPSALRDLLSVSYLSFFPLWAAGLFLATRRGEGFQRTYFTGFYLVYAIGFAGYAVFPAAGPFVYPPLAEKIVRLHPGGPLSIWNDQIVRGGCNGVDVFPSLHTAVTLFVLLSAFTVSRRLFAMLAPLCFLIVVATIGLQYHYSADLVAGALLGVTVWWLTVRRTTVSGELDAT